MDLHTGPVSESPVERLVRHKHPWRDIAFKPFTGLQIAPWREDIPRGDVFKGKDAQLEVAIENIQERLAADPKEVQPPPAFPIKRK